MFAESLCGLYGDETCIGKVGRSINNDGAGTFSVDVYRHKFEVMLKEMGAAKITPEDMKKKGGEFVTLHNIAKILIFLETEGAVFSIDGERDRLTLNRMLSCAELDEETFFGEVERFVNQLEIWTRIISDYNGQIERDKDQPGNAEMDDSALDIYHRMV